MLPEGTITYSNPCFSEMVGVPIDKVVGSSFVRFLPLQHHPLFTPFLERSRDGSGKAEFELLAKNGRPVPVQLSVRPLAISAPGGFCVVISDLGERRRSAQEHSDLAAIVESSLDAIISTSTEGIIRTWNAGAEKLYGYAASEVIGQSIFLIVPPKRRSEVEDFLNGIRQGKRIESYETVRVAKGGSRTDVSVTITPLKNARGEVIGASTITRDITERKRAEAENAGLAGIVNATDDAVFSTTREGVIATWNPGAERMLRYTAEEIRGKHFSLLIPEDRRPHLAADTEKLLRGEASVHYETEHQRKDGVWLQVLLTLSPIKDAAGVVTGVSVIARDITARKRAEAALIEEKHLLHTLMDNLPDLIYFKDRESRFTRINLALAMKLGLNHPDQAVGKTDMDFLAAEAAEEFRKDDAELLRTGQPLVDKEEKGIWRDGHVTWLSTTKMPLRDANGNIVGTFGLSHNITEHKRVVEALFESEENYRSLVSNIPDVVWRIDSNLHFAFISSSIERVSGFSPDEVYEQGTQLYLSALHPDDVHKVREGFRSLFAEGRPFDVEVRMRRKDGGWIWVHDRAHTTYEKNGIWHADGLLSDITEHKQAEAEHLRLVTAIEQAAEAVLITDTTGKIEYVNPAFTRVTGYSRDEALGQNPRILKSGAHDQAYYQQLWATILEGKTWQGELINRRRDGSLYTELTTIALVRNQAGEGTHFIATKQDISARKQLELQFLQAQKLEAVGRLAGGVAHDFNNLLTIINGYAQLIADRSSVDEHHRGMLEEILRAGERATALTRQLLAFSRRQVMEPRVLDLNKVLVDIEKMLRRLIGEDVEMVATLSPGLWFVRVDPGQVEQVIMNLAVNARDAMPEGGKFLIETSNIEIDAEEASRHENFMPGQYVMVAVSDTGCGMDTETQTHIFEPFFTTKEKGRGTGLGLATVYGIVRQSGGFIWVYSEPGAGSTFKLYFPRVEETAPTPEPAKIRIKELSGSETVLVVEDEKGVRSLVCHTLTEHGYTVLEAAGAEQALKISEEYPKPIHLLLTDVVMPQTGGKELANRLFTLHPETRQLYMSGYTDDAIVRYGILQGNTPFLQKPFGPSDLLKKVREVLKIKQTEAGTEQ